MEANVFKGPLYDTKSVLSIKVHFVMDIENSFNYVSNDCKSECEECRASHCHLSFDL